MNIQIAKQRINQVINVDSINNEEYDFMATHIPFNHIIIQNSISLNDKNYNNSSKDGISEEEVFNRLFLDATLKDKHQLVIVNGSSGSGKSHFIRWLYTKLLTADINQGENEVLLITRSDNTLKGTIKQLLKIDAVKNLKNKDIYERLIKANNTISDLKFKEEIFAKFIVEINVSDDEFLNNLEKKRLTALLNNDLFKASMMKADGPIERIFSKITATNISNIDIIAEFKKKDFVISTEFFDEMKDTADARAVSLAKKLVADDCDDDLLTKIVSFMNSKVDEVIQSCAGIEPGDFQQIFKEIRQELFKQNKNLILLIEDITSFTGINQALLNVLVTEHTGLNSDDKLCKLVSVVGTTKQYYDTFRDNYKDRITTEITLEDGIIGKNKEDLYLFFAKYLNAVSVLSDDFKSWYINTGADEKQIPVHISDVANWEEYDYENQKFSLYPFSKLAIINLYNSMDEHKTPRYILLKIIKPALDEIITDKSKFLTYLIHSNKPDLGDKIVKISNIIDKLDIKDKETYRAKALAFISLWGNGTLNSYSDRLAGIPKLYYDEFGFSELYESLKQSGTSAVNIDPTTPTPTTPIPTQKPKANKKFDDFKKMLDRWFYKKAIFVQPRYIVEELCGFVYNTINWQQNGVSNDRINYIIQSGYLNKIIAFERQEKASNEALIKLDDSMKTYTVLLAIGKWLYLGNKSWDFEGAYNSIFILTEWLESIKKKLIKIVHDYKEDEVPNYIKVSILALIYEKIINHELIVDKIEDISYVDIIEKPKQWHKGNLISEKWNSLIIYCEGNKTNVYDAVIDYFNISQGAKDGGHKFIDYYNFEKTLTTLKKKKYSLSDEVLEKSKYVKENEIYEYYSKIVKELPNVIEEQANISNELLNNIYAKFGWEINDEITIADYKELLDEFVDFYKQSQQNGFITSLNTNTINMYQIQSKDIVDNLKKLSNINKSSTIEILLCYSNSNILLINNFKNFLDKVENDININYPRLIEQINTYTKQGKWLDDDPRFSQYEKIKDILVDIVEK